MKKIGKILVILLFVFMLIPNVSAKEKEVLEIDFSKIYADLSNMTMDQSIGFYYLSELDDPAVYLDYDDENVTISDVNGKILLYTNENHLYVLGDGVGEEDNIYVEIPEEDQDEAGYSAISVKFGPLKKLPDTYVIDLTKYSDWQELNPNEREVISFFNDKNLLNINDDYSVISSPKKKVLVNITYDDENYTSLYTIPENVTKEDTITYVLTEEDKNQFRDSDMNLFLLNYKSVQVIFSNKAAITNVTENAYTFNNAIFLVLLLVVGIGLVGIHFVKEDE